MQCNPTMKENDEEAKVRLLAAEMVMRKWLLFPLCIGHQELSLGK